MQLKPIYRYFKIIYFYLFLTSASTGLAYTNIQTSTSLGYFRDYYKSNHFPVYHSWSVKGFYEKGLETDIEFYLNNDFSENTWTVMPTQVQLSVPISFNNSLQSNSLSHLKIGRQLYSEGFDLALIDGVILPYYLTDTAGISLSAGYLRSTDFEQPSDYHSQILGIAAWNIINDIQLRGGYTTRDNDPNRRYLHGALQYQFQQLWWQPTFYFKEELNADALTFNQNYSELVLQFSQTLDARFAYTNLDPRPTNKISKQNFIYSLFAISPTETAMTDLTWSYSEKLIITASIEKGFYNSGYHDETSERQDLSLDIATGNNQWLTPCFAHLKSYGGEITDLCLRYTSEVNSQSRYVAELDSAYVKKINQIEGWVEHLRGSYETSFWNSAKVLFAVEAERNQYFIFDIRTMAYVTNYL